MVTELLAPLPASDEVLLQQFAREHDQAAFAALVKRHAPLVWSVCRRIVHHHHSAEDAFQATFVVLMQKASRLTLRARLGTWLYAVAVKVARRTQARDARHQDTSKLPDVTSRRAVDQLTVQELMEIIRQEACMLPRRYQPVMDVCFFQQHSVSDAAERLGLTSGTVRGLLQRGRRLLQQRLLKRGIAPLALASLSLSSLLAELVPTSLLTATETIALSRVPKQLLNLTIPAASTLLKPLVLGAMVVLLAIGGIGLSMLPLVAATPSQPAFPHISVLHPTKQAADVCGYVDDHEGKPLAGAKVEVVRDSKVETTLMTDAVGRFAIPDEWKSNRTVNRILIVRTKDSLGWSSRLNYGSRPLQHDIMITVLPLIAQVQAKVSMKPASSIQQNQMGWFQHVQNGSLNALYVPPDLKFFQSTVKENLVTFQLPIHTTGTLFVNGQNHIGQRIQYSARGPGRCDLGTIGLKLGASISGTLVDDTGKPVHNAQLMAQSCNRAETNNIMHGTGAFCHTDATGHFSLDGLDERCEFNVMLINPIPQQNSPVPLVLIAAKDVKLKQGETTRLNLQLQPGRLVKGRMVEETTGNPIKLAQIGYHGTARPRTSAAIASSTTDQNGEFSFCVPPGPAYFYCCDGKAKGEIETTILTKGDVPDVLIKTVANTPTFPKGTVSVTVGYTELPDDPKQNVQARAVTEIGGIGEGITNYQQDFAIENADPLPTSVRFRLYHNKKQLQESDIVMRMQGTTAIKDKLISLNLPLKKDQEVTLELDAEGFAPLRRTLKEQELEPIKLQFVPVSYVPFNCKVVDVNMQPVQQARVQVELQRLGATIDSPWGPILQSDAMGHCKIDHLRVGDVYRVRVFCQNSQSTVTEWQTMTEKPGEQRITIP